MILFKRETIEELLPSDLAACVAHYTRIGTLCHFLPADRGGWASARATPVQFLNDRKELSLGLDVLREVANKPPLSGLRVRNILDNLTRSFGTLATDAFQMSFSGNPDELGQWRGYAANGMGCSVVTGLLDLHIIADVAGWVIYNDKKQKAFAYKVLNSLRHVTNDDEIQQVLISAASFMKHEGFAPEMEFRILTFPDVNAIQFRETGDRLVPYIDLFTSKSPEPKPLPLHKVIIGPGWQLANLSAEELAKHHVVQGIGRLLFARGLHTTGIETSQIPYDPR